jgi:uncharacterized repeat protein (TIGR03803 family)
MPHVMRSSHVSWDEPSLKAKMKLYGHTHAAASLVALCTLAPTAKAAPTLTTLATFNGTNGAYPEAGLILDGAGNMYGTTYGTYGGAPPGDGTVFKVPAGGGAVTTLATFNGSNGANPCAGLIADAEGNLYGTTYYGGASGYGTVFKVPAGGGAVITLSTFNGSNGANPEGGLITDAVGNLYGTSSSGGNWNCGTVFRVPAGGGSVTTLAAFTGANGAEPASSLIMDGAGNLYGTTYSAGSSGYGTVFKIRGMGFPITLASFNNSNGANPCTDLITDAAGNFYGTTQKGGAAGYGIVFEVPVGGGSVITLATFNGTNGAYPSAGLIMDAAGNLYGMTARGGGGPPNTGTVFKVPAGGGSVVTLATFNDTNGANPCGDLIADGAGNLYGVTGAGGASGKGTVFELSGTGFVVAAVPEPATLALLGFGAAVPWMRRRGGDEKCLRLMGGHSEA